MFNKKSVVLITLILIMSLFVGCDNTQSTNNTVTDTNEVGSPMDFNTAPALELTENISCKLPSWETEGNDYLYRTNEFYIWITVVDDIDDFYTNAPELDEELKSYITSYDDINSKRYLNLVHSFYYYYLAYYGLDETEFKKNFTTTNNVEYFRIYNTKAPDEEKIKWDFVCFYDNEADSLIFIRTFYYDDIDVLQKVKDFYNNFHSHTGKTITFPKSYRQDLLTWRETNN